MKTLDKVHGGWYGECLGDVAGVPRLFQRLCKPPNGYIIKIQVWRFCFAKKKKNTGGNCS